MYLHFEMQPPGTVELVRSCPHPICSLAGQLTTGVWEQMYIFINDSEDRVVECISIQGLWS